MIRARGLVIAALLVTAQLSNAQAPAQGPPQAPPRGRSITLGDVISADMKDNVFTIGAGQDLLRVIFYRDDVFRIWVGPDSTFTEAQPSPDDAQMVVFKGPAMQVAWRDAGDYYRLDSKECVLRVYKKPLRFALFDKDNVAVVWQESRPLSYGPSSVQTLRRDLQWKAFTPALMIISGWSKQTNLMKQPWIFGDPYTGYNRRYLKLKMRLTPYLYTYSREAYDTGVPTVRAMVLEFPGDTTTWSKRTQYQLMNGE